MDRSHETHATHGPDEIDAGPVAPTAPHADTRARHAEMVLTQVDALPTLSPIASRLISLSASDGVEIAEITTLIESDPAMASKVLGLCRRSDLGLGDRITSVKRAVVLLGIEPIRAAALSIAVFDLMRPATNEPSPAAPSVSESAVFDRLGFWKHLIAVACACELLAAAAPAAGVKPEEAFVAGLLHALGKPVLEMVLPRSYARVIALAERQGLDSAPVERAIIGIDHHTAGKRLGERWGLPTDLCDVMWLCGQGVESLPDTTSRRLVGLVILARAVARRLHLGWSGDFGPVQDPRTVWASLGLGDGADAVLGGRIEAKLHAAVADRLAVLGIADGANAGAEAPALLMESLLAANRELGRINAALEQRGRAARHGALVLTAIAEFHKEAAAARSVEEVARSIAASLGVALGEGPVAVLWRARPGETWELLRCASSEACAPARRVGHANTFTLAQLGGALPPELRSLRMLPLAAPEVAPDDATAVVLHACPRPEAVAGPLPWRALVGAWTAALVAAMREGELKRLGEELAAHNRGLTSMQSTLTRSQSLARLGEMTAGAAHEMNNPLTVISGHCQLLGARLRDPKDRAAIGAVIAAADQLTELVKSLHLMANPPAASPTAVDLGWAIGEAVALARRASQREIPAEFRAGAVPTLVRADPLLFTEALAEIMRNAAEADPRGTIVISAEIDTVEDRLNVTIRDRGPGFSERALEHAFDPFFSERDSGRGRGLGLTRARSLAEAMQGVITIKSQPGEGAQVTLAIRGWRVPMPQAARPTDQRTRTAA